MIKGVQEFISSDRFLSSSLIGVLLSLGSIQQNIYNWVVPCGNGTNCLLCIKSIIDIQKSFIVALDAYFKP